ncbi:hypothetical protein OIU76_024288 [Salix suchowensis]|nr:hypothetical protein OIU76_024288 [Salix suchowensis]
MIGLVFWLFIMFFHDKLTWIFTSSEPVLEAVNKLSILLAFTVLLNSVQPVLSGVAVGSGWQKYVAYINLGCYYGIGVPLGFLMGWIFHQGVMGNMGWNDFRRNSSSNTNLDHHYYSMQLGKRGRESKPACIEVVGSSKLKMELISFGRSST